MAKKTKTYKVIWEWTDCTGGKNTRSDTFDNRRDARDFAQYIKQSFHKDGIEAEVEIS